MHGVAKRPNLGRGYKVIGDVEQNDRNTVVVRWRQYRCGDLQRALADRAVFQSTQAESQDQDLRGNLSQCGQDPSVDGADCNFDSALLAA